MSTTTSYDGGCTVICEACELDKVPREHPVEFDGLQGSNRPIQQDNPLDVNIPLTDDGDLRLTAV